MKITIDSFSGMVPKVAPEMLGKANGVVAENVNLEAKKLFPAECIDVYYPVCDMVPGQIHDDECNRLYVAENGKVMVVGTFEGNGSSADTLRTRELAIPAPGAPREVGRASYILSSLGIGDDSAELVAFYDNAPEYESKIAPIVFGKRTLEPIDGWKRTGNTFTRRYKYLPRNVNAHIESGFQTQVTTYYNPSFEAALVVAGNVKIRFSNKAGYSGALTNSSGEKVGTYTTSAIKISPATDFELGSDVPVDSDTGEINYGTGNAIKRYLASDLFLTVTLNYNTGNSLKDAYYVARYVESQTGAEGPPSELSPMISRYPDEDILLECDTTSAQAHFIDKVRFYRSGGVIDTGFMFMSEVEINNSSTGEDDNTNSENTRIWTSISSNGIDDTIEIADTEVTPGFTRTVDSFNDGELAEKMPEYGEPPEKISGIAGHSGGFLVAWHGKDIRFSSQYLPNTWPWEYSHVTPFEIVALAVRGNYLYAMTKGSLSAFVGDTPDQMIPMHLGIDIPCVSKASVANVNGKIIYAGSRGLVMIAPGGYRIVSESFMNSSQYKKYDWQSCVASGAIDNKYVAVMKDHQALIFDLENNTFSSMSSDAVHLRKYHWDDGKNSISTGGSDSAPEQDVILWPQKETPDGPYGSTIIIRNNKFSIARWRSRSYVFERPVTMSVARVISYPLPTENVSQETNGDITMIIRADGDVAWRGNIDSSSAFKLPKLPKTRRWDIEVVTGRVIVQIDLAESMTEL